MASRRATIFLTAKDLEHSRRFYTEDLGLQESSAASNHVAYELGS
ncbi:MAG: VOC family protein [Nitrospinota bacterium]